MNLNRLRRKKRSGFTLIELLLVITIIGILIAILLPALVGAMDAANRLACSANLAGIGKAIATYSTKYNGHYPTVYQYAVPPATVNGQPNPIQNWTGGQGWAAANTGYVGLDTTVLTDQGGSGVTGTPPVQAGASYSQQKASFTCNLSCLFLLVKSGDASDEKIFLCKADPMALIDNTVDAQNMWSFQYITNCSYSYQDQVYDSNVGLNGGGRNTSSNNIDAKMIVAADMNPSRYNDGTTHVPAEVPTDQVTSGVCTWNSPNHKFSGQNCLYGDGHVAWNTTAFCGYDNTNIWTQGCSNTANVPPVTVWSNTNPVGSGATFLYTPTMTSQYGGATAIGVTGAGSGDKYNSFLVP